MKRMISALLAALMLLALAACGSNTPSGSGDAGANNTADGTEATATVSGVINRVGDFLVLLTDDNTYAVFDFGEDVDPASLKEGDSVTVTYTGELGSEDPAPVAVSVEVTEEA